MAAGIAWAFFKRDLREQMSYKSFFAFDLLRLSAQVLVFYFVARTFVPGAGPHLAAYGGDYFAFALIGIAFAGYQSAALNSFSAVLDAERGNGTLEAILVTPTPLRTVILAGSAWSFVLTTLRALAHLLIGALILDADLSKAHWGAAAATVALTVAALAGLGLASAGLALVFKRGSPVTAVLSGISRLLAGVYFPLSVLPESLQAMARIFPLTFSLEALRRALLLGAGPAGLGRELAALAAFAVALLPVGVAVLRWGVRRAKEDGSLGLH